MNHPPIPPDSDWCFFQVNDEWHGVGGHKLSELKPKRTERKFFGAVARCACKDKASELALRLGQFSRKSDEYNRLESLIKDLHADHDAWKEWQNV